MVIPQDYPVLAYDAKEEFSLGFCCKEEFDRQEMHNAFRKQFIDGKINGYTK